MPDGSRAAADADLRSSATRVGSILESAMDAIITVDSEQRVVLFNRAAEEVFGWTREEALGASLDVFIPTRFREAHRELVQRFGESGTRSRRMGGQRIVRGLRRSGEEFPIDASISHVDEQGERYYTVILRDVTERIRAEEELRASREEIRDLSFAASTALEDEKRRIARELHDELGQALTALKIDVAWVRAHVPAESGALRDKLAAMQELLDSTMAAARRISSDLRPLMLDDLGLAAACEWLVDNFRRRTGAACELVLAVGEPDLADPHSTAVFRVLQESLTNIARHANARRVEVTLERDRDRVALTVRDDGSGFDPAGPRPPGSLGLMGLRERAYVLGGEIRVESAPGAGTLIELRLPLAPGTAP